ncbi:MAG: hypothetical protein WCI74_20630 [Actinomycetes bacterium]
MEQPVSGRRALIVVGATLLLVSSAAAWAIPAAGSLLNQDPNHNPDVLRLRVLSAAALADRVAIEDAQTVAHAAMDSRSPQALALAARLGKGFADLVEPTSISIGMTIVKPSPAPLWYLPCFRSMQADMHALGNYYLALSSRPWTSDVNAGVERANRTLDDLASLVRQVVPDGLVFEPNTTIDPLLACQRIDGLASAIP